MAGFHIVANLLATVSTWLMADLLICFCDCDGIELPWVFVFLFLKC